MRFSVTKTVNFSPAMRQRTRKTSTACSATAHYMHWAAGAAEILNTQKKGSRTAVTARFPIRERTMATLPENTRKSWSLQRKTENKFRLLPRGI